MLGSESPRQLMGEGMGDMEVAVVPFLHGGRGLERMEGLPKTPSRAAYPSRRQPGVNGMTSLPAVRPMGF